MPTEEQDRQDAADINMVTQVHFGIPVAFAIFCLIVWALWLACGVCR